MWIKQIIFLSLLMSMTVHLQAQTCCSGGVPVSTNIGFQSGDRGDIQFSLAFENNVLESLYNFSEELNQNNRKRTTNSLLFRLSYDLHSKWNIETLLPYVTQKRLITQNNGKTNEEISQGVGDLVVLLKYDLVKNIAWNVSIGAGPKLAIGSTDQRNNLGLLLVNDMQPGSGALDLLSRLAIIHNLKGRPSTSMFLTGILNYRGVDPDYLGNQRYRFGRDLNVTFGLSDQIILGSRAVFPGFSIRYRNARRDNINSNDLENTGGEWLFLRGNIGIQIKEKYRLSVSYEVPLFTKVDGTQLSPDRIFNIGVYGSIATKSTQKVIELENLKL